MKRQQMSSMMMGPTTQPGAAQGGMPGMPGATTLAAPGTAQEQGQQGAANGSQGGSSQPGKASQTGTKPAGTYTNDPPVPHGAYSGGQTQNDVNITYPPNTTPGSVARAEAARQAETEGRLRALEEKLDRVLKALDAPRTEAPKGATVP
jgi:hypothetical protein